MSYGSDYVTADPADAPLDAPLLVGADPVLWLALGLLLLAAGLFGWWLGVRSRSREGDATAAIWKAVDKAAKEAMKADDHALRSRTQHLLETLDQRLGRTLAVAVAGPEEDDGLADRVGALRAAVGGRRRHDPAPGPDATDPPDVAPAAGGHDQPAAPDEHDAGGAQPPNVASAITINVTGGAGQDGTRRCHPPRREMTAREQTDALRLAVAAFNEHWRHESRRVGEFRAALAELAGSGERGSRAGRG